MFHSFFLDDRKQYDATTTAHSNRLIELPKKKLMSTLSTIWENTDVCAVVAVVSWLLSSNKNE